MTTTLYALNGKVIIEPITEEKTDAGLVVQTSQDIKVAKGKIVNVSTLVWNEFSGRFVLMQTGDLVEEIEFPYMQINDDDRKLYEHKQTHYISVGDVVIYDKLSAYEAKLDKTYHIVDRRSILAIIKESNE